MIESHLHPGAQKFTPGRDDPAKLAYGTSITDPCLGWEHTVEALGILERRGAPPRDDASLTPARAARRRGDAGRAVGLHTPGARRLAPRPRDLTGRSKARSRPRRPQRRPTSADLPPRALMARGPAWAVASPGGAVLESLQSAFASNRSCRRHRAGRLRPRRHGGCASCRAGSPSGASTSSSPRSPPTAATSSCSRRWSSTWTAARRCAGSTTSPCARCASRARPTRACTTSCSRAGGRCRCSRRARASTCSCSTAA